MYSLTEMNVFNKKLKTATTKEIPGTLFYTSEVWADLRSPSCWESWNINLFSDRFLFTQHSQQLWNWGICLPVLNHFKVRQTVDRLDRKLCRFIQMLIQMLYNISRGEESESDRTCPLLVRCSSFNTLTANGSLKLLAHVIEPPRTIRNLSTNLLTKIEDLLWILKTCHIGHRHLQWLDFRFLRLHTRGSQILPQT